MVMSQELVLEGTGLVKEFVQGASTLRVLDGASIVVRAGERIAIVGASGSGKTTLLQVLGGLDLPTQGSVRIAGAAMNELNDTERGELRNRAVGFVYQFHHLLPEFTALENVMMPLLIRGASVTDAEPRSLARLDEVGLRNRASHRAGELSGGEQQRVALARALAGNPTVLLADEPTGNLDFRTGEMIVALLEDLHRSHKLTSIFVTHNLSFATRCDRILQLDKGVLATWTGDGFPLCRPDQEQPIMWKDGGNYV